MYYRVIRHNNQNRFGGYRVVTDNINLAIEHIANSTTRYVRLRIVDAWYCKFCNQLNYNAITQCSYCGRGHAKIRTK